jgi:Ca2+-binding RTX toxin-like protein
MDATALPGCRRNLKTAIAGGALAIGLAVAAFAVTAVEVHAKPTCGGRKATIVRGDGNDVISVPKHGPQVIFAGGGNDTIIAKRNKDTVCAGDGDDFISGGTGRDMLFGEAGNDVIDEGPGSGKAFGGPGDDTLLGGGGGDSLHGDDGGDRIFGQIQDDHLSGDSGNDLIVGGQGTDDMQGGRGDDWLRGGINNDFLSGDDGNDTLSFGSATPPGPSSDLNGVSVNLRSGDANGDDSPERLSGIENLVGSPFDDHLVGVGRGFANGDGGSDSCGGFAGTSCNAMQPPRSTAYIANPTSPDPGLIVLGGPGSDSVSVNATGNGLSITGQLSAGAGCAKAGAASLSCAAPAAPLGYIVLWGDRGNDTLSVGGGLPAATEVVVDGGPGNDDLTGGPGSDVLFAGESGADHLSGGVGDDGLIGGGGGPDTMDGGPGNDNIVSDNPCDGHRYIGGPGGADAASFGHVMIGGVSARLNGAATLRRSGGGCNPTQIQGSEVLEGSIGSDFLVGTRHDDLLVGLLGSDVLIGRGGHDDFRGDAGSDRCMGRGAKSSC